MIEIKNLRKEKPLHPWDIRVDRTSILGNPYYMNNESQRDFVCDRYQKLFEQKMVSGENWQKEIARIKSILTTYGKLNLFCWCTPKRCHAETIKKFLEDDI